MSMKFTPGFIGSPVSGESLEFPIPTLSTPTALSQLKRMKHHLVEELIVSEIKYIRYLKKIFTYFAEPLSLNELLPDDMHAEIFGRLKPILSVNETLLESILTLGIEEAFLMVTPCLKLYADYARRYQTTLVLLETCITFNVDLYRFIGRQENSPDVNLQLSALLIMPIQRVPRYSLMLQELLLVCLQLDGLDSMQAQHCVRSIIEVTQTDQVIPEQVCARVMSMYECAQSRQPYAEDSDLSSNLMFLGNFMHRLRFRTVQLIAVLASISATATYLNEQIRITDQADVAALLQSRLLGRWTSNLLLVPGRRLLRLGLVSKVNEFDGRGQPRLLVLLSDILIFATPYKRHQLRPVSKPLRTRKPTRSNALIRSRLDTQHWHSKLHRIAPISSTPKRSLRRRLVLSAWLNTVARPTTPNFTHDSPLRLLANKNIRFSGVTVYPLHHCRVEPLFNPSAQLSQTLDSRSVPVTSMDESLARSRMHTLISQLSLTPGDCDRSLWSPSIEDSTNQNAFTVHCRGASFTVVVDSRTYAEDWVRSLDDAIRAVQLARQSLRKESSAKRPMAVYDFIHYEQWLETKRADTMVRRFV
ncbi:hypothetical protein PHET_08967 [Paragonimus heterotremus]|uniref:DH domain-containing protein n=1 Tax=Paragonimus heterotremus TaxID=100268 RepID=A0A8J4WP18_9TREM|nr:hypothetical protein PHET_08967 [Paragonimus heterotremus]